MGAFRLVSGFQPKGDQPKAIDALVEGVRGGLPRQVLLGVTGSGKTFTMAHAIARLERPALVIAPNKTLAAQLYGEFKALFPENAVEYFVSYYDYYQPEAYLPTTDTYIEKDASINEAIDKLRHAATRALLERPDTVIVASVSCIYGLGSPEAYQGMVARVEEGRPLDRDDLLGKLVEIQYERSDLDFRRGTFRVRGGVVEVFPADRSDAAVRVEFEGEAVAGVFEFDPLLGEVRRRLGRFTVFPASHYVTARERLLEACEGIERELLARLAELHAAGKLLEEERLGQRTRFDLEMLRETGRCAGIENYSRHLTGRRPGEPPPTLIDYLPRDALLFIDESHVTVPQVQGMYRGDRSRKETLVEFGFRLPSALDNRPLTFEEFEARSPQTIYVSATPAEFEVRSSKGRVVEQLIRPTGLTDPEVVVKPARGQVEDLLAEVRARVAKGHRTLVTTLTKRMAEELTEYLAGLEIRVRYMHHDVETLERSELLRALRAGEFDVLVGINLLREGLDLPEVSLVAILDADKEGFLRSARSLIQTIGRAARHVEGRVVLYADKETDSIRKALDETNRRRRAQAAYNERHGITPETIRKEISTVLSSIYEKDYAPVPEPEQPTLDIPPEAIPGRIQRLQAQMKAAARRLEFERAARLRDEIKRLQAVDLGVRM